jgi:ribosomal protein L29
MGMILFDTLKLSRTLRDKGHFTSEQAEALAEALGEASQDNLATKADLTTVTADLKTEIAELRTELKTEIAELRTELRTGLAESRTGLAEVKSDLLRWIIGAIGFQTVAILSAVFAMVRFVK